MNAPIELIEGFFDTSFESLWETIEWERRDTAPRRECWMTDTYSEYTYGSGAGERTYEPREWHPVAKEIQSKLKDLLGYTLEGCFVNGYDNERQHLGWHADDSPEMDDDRAIAVVSYGAERYINFRPRGHKGVAPVTLLMPSGSLLLMKPGMQDEWDHKIPKHSAACGPRLSLTYRGIV